MLQTWLLKLGVFLLKKPSFKKWAKLEDKKYDAIKAVEQAYEGFPQLLYEYLSTALIFHPTYSKVYWKDVLDAFVKIHGINIPKRAIPLVSKSSMKSDKTRDPWDYSGRLWYFYSHILADAYGWSEKVIANLSIDDALAYVQEVLTDRQLEREFHHSLSELSYPYNKATKKSKYVPMHRPYWMMLDGKEEKKKVPAVPKNLLPVGIGVRQGEKVKATLLGGDVETLPSIETRH